MNYHSHRQLSTDYPLSHREVCEVWARKPTFEECVCVEGGEPEFLLPAKVGGSIHSSLLSYQRCSLFTNSFSDGFLYYQARPEKIFPFFLQGSNLKPLKELSGEITAPGTCFRCLKN